jgi:transcriptional regulator with XRE-family HTH domain
LKRLREARGLTQQELGWQSGCHAMTIAKLERGVQEPAWPLVLALAKALGVSCEAFRGEADGGPVGQHSPSSAAAHKSRAEASAPRRRGRPRKQRQAAPAPESPRDKGKR